MNWDLLDLQDFWGILGSSLVRIISHSNDKSLRLSPTDNGIAVY